MPVMFAELVNIHTAAFLRLISCAYAWPSGVEVPSDNVEIGLRIDVVLCTVLSTFPDPHLTTIPTLKAQEIPLEDPDSCNMFRPGPEKPLVATPAAIEMYSHGVIIECWKVLRKKADDHGGIDYLQVFEDDTKSESLWFIEDGPGGAITALLPSDY